MLFLGSPTLSDSPLTSIFSFVITPYWPAFHDPSDDLPRPPLFFFRTQSPVFSELISILIGTSQSEIILRSSYTHSGPFRHYCFPPARQPFSLSVDISTPRSTLSRLPSPTSSLPPADCPKGPFLPLFPPCQTTWSFLAFRLIEKPKSPFPCLTSASPSPHPQDRNSLGRFYKKSLRPLSLSPSFHFGFFVFLNFSTSSRE